MNMQNIFRVMITLSVIIVSILNAGLQYSEYLYVPWGNTENTLKHKLYPEYNEGPDAFQVIGEQVMILDSKNQKLKTFDRQGLLKSMKLESSYIIDFYQQENNLFLADPLHIYKKGRHNNQLISEEKDSKKMFQGFYKQKGLLCVKHSDGMQQMPSKSLKKAAVSNIRVTRELPDRVKVAINGQPINIYVPEVGSVDYLGSTSQDLHYIYAESITCHAPLAVDRFVFLINAAGDIKSKIKLPPQKFTYVFREFDVDDQGNLYHMHSAKDGIHIIQWEYDPDLPYTEAEYPKKFQEVYHFNHFRKDQPEITNSNLAKIANSQDLQPVTRTQALATGDEYVTHIWTATPANIGTTDSWKGKVISVPWVKVGKNQRIPYRAENYDNHSSYITPEEFDSAIAKGKLAGNLYAFTDPEGKAVGTSCACFVSLCWELGRNYFLSGLCNSSKPLDSFNELLPADMAFSWWHVRLVVGWTPDGKLIQSEMTNQGYPGFAARYYTFSLSDMEGYTPRRYKHIVNKLAPLPSLNYAVTEADSVVLQWDADDSLNFTGYRIYRQTPEDTSFMLVDTLSKGTHDITLALGSDIHSAYKVATYKDDETASDVYAVKRATTGKDILIVDGFDRYQGSYLSRTHDFVTRIGEILDLYDLAYESCANEAVARGAVDLKDYDLVWWILGDESMADETFENVEQDSIKSYLKQGGKFFTSGSELGWDLDANGSGADKEFMHNYLKAAYAEDKAGNYTVYGRAGSPFENIKLHYADRIDESGIFPEDSPDVLAPFGKSAIALKYGNNKTAGVYFAGLVPEGTIPCKVMMIGFPFETITTDLSKKELTEAVLKFMGYYTGLKKETESPVLYSNYPNPFNPTTIIKYNIPQTSNVVLTIYNLNGQVVDVPVNQKQKPGSYQIEWNASQLASGIYIYKLQAGKFEAEKKCLLIK